MWNGQNASWNTLSNLRPTFLKPPPISERIAQIADNFINWPSDYRDTSVLVGGHIFVRHEESAPRFLALASRVGKDRVDAGDDARRDGELDALG